MMTPQTHAGPAGPIINNVVRWNHPACLLASGCWLSVVLLLHAMNAWHVLAHRIVGPEHWAFPAENSLFNMQGEHTIPAWFSGVMLWTAGLGILVLAVLNFRLSRLTGLQWAVLGATFLYLSADEVLALHEKLNAPAARLLEDRIHLASPWVIFGAPFAAVIGLICLPLMRKISPTARVTFVLAGVVFVTGAIGVELAGETVKRILHGGEGSKLYTFFYTTEELLEMLGVVIFLHAMHLQLASHWRGQAVSRAGLGDTPGNTLRSLNAQYPADPPRFHKPPAA